MVENQKCHNYRTFTWAPGLTSPIYCTNKFNKRSVSIVRTDTCPINAVDSLGLEIRWMEEWTGQVDHWTPRVVGDSDWISYGPATYHKTSSGTCYTDQAQFRLPLVEYWGRETQTRWEESRSWAIKTSIVATVIASYDEESLGALALSVLGDEAAIKGAEVTLENLGWHEVPGTRETITPFDAPILTQGPPEPEGVPEYRHLFSVAACPCD